MKRGNILAIVGGQYGSEGKGVICYHLKDRYPVHVRVGGPQAGHSFKHGGKIYKMQIIPCGWANPDALLYLGRGMLIKCDLLVKEIEMIRKIDPTIIDRVRIDALAGTMDDTYSHDPSSQAREKRIGSTGEGVGSARVSRIQRDPEGFFHAGQVAQNFGTKHWSMSDLIVDNTPELLDHFSMAGMDILLEGSQGYGLSLIHGRWPYTTNHDTTAAQLAADIGIAPRHVNQTLLVARTYPIRVAGTSGYLKGELSWEQLSQRVGRNVSETTTVTKRIRRVGEWDEDLFKAAVIANGPTSIAVTFIDYLSPEDEGKTDWAEVSDTTRSFVKYIETISGTKVQLVGTGGKDDFHVIDSGGAL